MTTAHRTVLLALVATIGCGPKAAAQPSADTGTSTVTGTTPSTTTGAVEDSGPESGDLLPPPDFGGFVCNPWTQDCPAGEKCVWWSSRSSVPDMTKCTPVADDPARIGEPCESLGPTTGLDDCELGTQCWFEDAYGIGVCVGHCTGSIEQPLCADPSTECSILEIGQGLCLPPCHPLQDDCAAGDLCIPFNDRFACVFDAEPTDSRRAGDGCYDANYCDSGHWCGPPSWSPLCEPDPGACCIAYCDLTIPASCATPGAACVPWFDPPAPEGLGNVGACRFPP